MHMVEKPETNTRKVVARLKRDGWFIAHRGRHDIYEHAEKPGGIQVPRHRELSSGVARSIARSAGWITKERKS